jgi:hypothetical protein
MGTGIMPAAPAWYRMHIDGEEPQVCELVDEIIWAFDCELGKMAEYLRNHGEVWSERIRVPYCGS